MTDSSGKQDYTVKMIEAKERLDGAITTLLRYVQGDWSDNDSLQSKKRKILPVYGENKSWIWQLDSVEMREISNNLNIIRVLLLWNYMQNHGKVKTQ